MSSFLRAVWRLGSGTRKMVSASPAILDSLAFSLFRPYEPVPCLTARGMEILQASLFMMNDEAFKLHNIRCKLQKIWFPTAVTAHLRGF